MARFKLVATGGTFDELHVGHIALLTRAFESGDHVIIGVTSDEFASKYKKLNHGFDERVHNLKEAIKKEFGASASYEIARLDSEFGPAVTTGDVEALVASAETGSKIARLNEIRQKNGLAPAQLVSVELVKAEDGRPVSSTRIRAGEIDSRGRLLKK
ncbi:pantetheine-phosphate adenylyltransferase [Nitrososphaera sp.]|uniref:phosphopantetheine adenylyltransferase n=1 Tax=Nitrososphaera sp. TaxID=1971748 RepID=UPI00307E86EC